MHSQFTALGAFTIHCSIGIHNVKLRTYSPYTVTCTTYTLFAFTIYSTTCMCQSCIHHALLCMLLALLLCTHSLIIVLHAFTDCSEYIHHLLLFMHSPCSQLWMFSPLITALLLYTAAVHSLLAFPHEISHCSLLCIQ